ncbi:MAG: pro-sigmaK processing inhibitor BofA family protein [Anaerotignum sp.]|nr:pro-sigmaK processing inhibitor BofA family protein [Anaerotignum sp.]
MGEYVMTCAIFVCLLALALIALAKPLRLLVRFGFSAVLGGFALFLGQSLGAAVGLNAATLLVAGVLGLPGVAGMYVLSFLL